MPLPVREQPLQLAFRRPPTHPPHGRDGTVYLLPARPPGGTSLAFTMIIRPKTRGFVCITAHPQGCAAHVQSQIDTILRRGPIDGGPKKVLVIGASTGYGRASRIAAAFVANHTPTVLTLRFTTLTDVAVVVDTLSWWRAHGVDVRADRCATNPAPAASASESGPPEHATSTSASGGRPNSARKAARSTGGR